MPLSRLNHARARIRVASLAVLTVFLVAATTTTASAATFSSTGLSATVDGTSVTARVTMTSSPGIVVDVAKVCVRSSSGANFDFPRSTNVSITAGGTVWQKSATFPAGTYRYWACIKEAGQWIKFSDFETFTVGGGAASGAAMPVGDLPGWRQTFTEDFNEPLARGAFPGPYASQWTSYSGFPNTSKAGYYDKKIISAQDGVLDLYLHAENDRPLTAAPVPLVDGKWGGQTYGRFSVRMKADPIGGYGASFLLWSDNDDWNEGEVDFPESTFSEAVKGYNHCLNNPADNCMWVHTDKRYDTWHTYTIDWRPEKLAFLVDGVEVASTTRHIPSKPLHWVMQVETPTPSSARESSGHLLIDWATIYSRV